MSTKLSLKLPEGWKSAELGFLGDALIGLTYKPSDITDELRGNVVLRSSNIRHSSIILDDNVYVGGSIPKRAIVKNGDILVCVRNGSRSLIGKAARISREHRGMAFGAFMSVFRSRLNYYLGYVFQSEIFRHEIHKNLGATINQITSRQLLRFKLPLPPSKERKQIARVLGTMDEVISKTNRLIEQKKLRKKYLMQTLLTGKKRLKGFKKAKWQTFRFRELATESIARNNGKMSNDRLMAVSKFHGLIPMRERVQGASNYRCKTIGRNYFAYNPMRLNIGSLARWENDEPAMVSGDYVVFKCIEDRLDPNFFDFYRETNEWANYVRRAGDGSVRVRIYFSHLCPLKLKLPPVDEQKAIAKIIDLADWKITLLETKAEFLRLQKKWLMQVLLTGKRRLKVGK